MHRLVLVLGLVALVAAATAHAFGRAPKPAFATPGAAVYCSIDATTYDNPSPKIFCWRPRDGRAFEINWRGRAANTNVWNTQPVVESDYRNLMGYRPRARVLRHGQRWTYRCPLPGGSIECPAGRERAVAFTCTSRRTGVTCVNAVRHGFVVSRTRHRLF